jgi:hypothetical protein
MTLTNNAGIGQLEVGNIIVTNRLFIGTNASALGQIVLKSSVSQNDGIRFGDDTILYKASLGQLNLTGPAAADKNVGQLRIFGQIPMTNGNSGRIAFGAPYTAAGALADYATVGGYKLNDTTGNYDGYFAIGVRPNGGTMTERLRIMPTGYVGIGTTNPLASIHVNGSALITGTNYFFYVSGTNWAGTWADYAGVYHGVNSNGTIRTLTNLWGF